MKRILVPTDFSENAQRALDFAAGLARKVSGEIYLLHVVSNDDDIFNATGNWGGHVSAEMPTMIGTLKITAARMNKIIQQPALEDVTVYDEVEVGVPGIHINIAAKKYKADVIVMGTHGSKGLSEVLMGSTAEKVVQLTDRPVITIQSAYVNKLKKIVFATDFSDEADMVFDTIRKFAAIYEADIHLLTVNTDDKLQSYQESEKLVNEFRERHGVNENPFSVYNDHTKEAGILHFVKDIGADMIAIGSHGRSGLSRFFNHSISEQLMNHSFCPVLTVNFNRKVH